MASTRNLVVQVMGQILVDSYNIQTKQHIKRKEKLPNYGENFTRFFGHLQSMFNLNQVKAIAFTSIGSEFMNSVKFYAFRLKCREFCQRHQIFCYFALSCDTQNFLAISQTKTMVKEGEKVMIFLLDFGFPPTGISFVRKANNYQMHMIKNGNCNIKPFTQRWENELFENTKPTKLILVKGPVGNPGSSDFEEAEKYFKSYNRAVVDFEDLSENHMDVIVDKVLHLMGEKINPYDVEVSCLGTFEVKLSGKSLISVTKTDVTPFEKSVVINVNPKQKVSMYYTFPALKPPGLIEEIKLSTFKSKKVKVTLKLDINSFYDFKVEPFDGKKEESKKIAPTTSSEGNESNEGIAKSSSDVTLLPEKAQMVFDKQNFSVSYFAGGKEYGLNDADGLPKTPIYISFHEKKPIIGKTAMEIYGEKPKFVVFDLIKLCSVSTDDIINPKWGFRLSKESESLIVIMETFDDEKKSTVEFLLAIILKEGKNRIKKETGKRMEEIEIKFDGFSPNETLKKNFVEAGKLLKINILFV